MALIVELFGPPGSGKTTFAKALAARLRTAGVEVGIHLSSRPGEEGAQGPTSARWRRLSRPVWELIAMRAAAPARDTSATARLSPFLAKLGRLRRLRMRQYLFRLAAARAEAEAVPGVYIFDQAYLQFVVTLLASGEGASVAELAGALRAVPQADVALRVDAAPDALERRLRLRHSQIGVLGRWLEAGAGSGRAYLRLSAILSEELAAQRRIVMTTRSSEGESFAREVERAATAILRSRKSIGSMASVI